MIREYFKDNVLHVAPRSAKIIYGCTVVATIIFTQFIEESTSATVMFLFGMIIGWSLTAWKRNRTFHSNGDSSVGE
jgi:xanthine/uracil permease